MLICIALQTHKNIVMRQLYSRLAVPRPLGSEIQPWTRPLSSRIVRLIISNRRCEQHTHKNNQRRFCQRVSNSSRGSVRPLCTIPTYVLDGKLYDRNQVNLREILTPYCPLRLFDKSSAVSVITDLLAMCLSYIRVGIPREEVHICFPLPCIYVRSRRLMRLCRGPQLMQGGGGNMQSPISFCMYVVSFLYLCRSLICCGFILLDYDIACIVL
jgi:hypothetical protein